MLFFQVKHIVTAAKTLRSINGKRLKPHVLGHTSNNDKLVCKLFNYSFVLPVKVRYECMLHRTFL